MQNLPRRITLVEGKNIIFQEVQVADAEFILSLRLNQKRNRFISPVENNVEKQRDWIRAHQTLGNEYYFVGKIKSGLPYGVFRIYDIKGDSFGIGSWINKEGAPLSGALESYFLAHDLFFFKLGFRQSHFHVRKDNKNIVNFHRRMGAKMIKEDEINFYFTLSSENYEKTRQRYKKYLCSDINYECQ